MPGVEAVFGRDDIQLPFAQMGFEYSARNGVVICNQDRVQADKFTLGGTFMSDNPPEDLYLFLRKPSQVPASSIKGEGYEFGKPSADGRVG